MMTEDHSVSPSSPHATQRLGTALIIDDAYDVLAEESLPEEAVGKLTDAIAASEEEASFRSTLSKFGCPPTGMLSFPTGALEKLYEATDSLPTELQTLLETHLFADTRAKRQQVASIKYALERANVNVDTAGSTSALPDSPPDVVFLDYFLGISSDAEARARAVERLKEIEAVYSSRVPFVVLMSSRPITIASREALRSDSGWVAGLFDFSPKVDLQKPDSLALRVLLWEMVLPNRMHIYHFVSALDKSVASLSATFMTRVRSLGLEDYAFLQRLHLAADGQPLGEYMLWLFGSLLPHLAFDHDMGVAATREQLDRVRFDSLLPGNWEPSPAVAECYRLAISTPAVGRIAAHPLHPPPPAPPGLPYLQTGDLFSSRGDDVWLVASPACDIAFAPGSKRDNPDRYVVMIPGKLVAITMQSPPIGEDEIVTRLFERDGLPYRIFWTPTRPDYVRHGDVETWRRARNLDRTARLRLPYALEVQQAFARNLVRIGMPVPPPLPFNASVQLYRKGSTDSAEPIGDAIEAGARVMVLRDGHQFHLSIEVVHSIIAVLPTVRDALRSEATSLRDGPQRNALLDKVRLIEDLLGKPEVWAELAGSTFDVPSGAGEVKIFDKLIYVYFGQRFDGRYGNKPPLCLGIPRNI